MGNGDPSAGFGNPNPNQQPTSPTSSGGSGGDPSGGFGSSGGSGYEVVPSSIRSVATIWDKQSADIGKVPGITAGIHISHLDAGLFQLIVSPYESLLNAITERCEQGKVQLAAVATELRASATAYEQTENENTSRSKGIGNG